MITEAEFRAIEQTKLSLIQHDGFYNQSSHEYASNTGLFLETLAVAHEAYKLANSYRQFRVGAAIAGIVGKEHYISAGANIKLSETHHPNIHAEQLALEKQLSIGATALQYIAIVGDIQPDQQSGRLLNTLHPCGICRTMCAESHLVNPNKTLFVMTTPDMAHMEISTLRGLQAFHTDDIDTSGILQIPGPQHFGPGTDLFGYSNEASSWLHAFAALDQDVAS